MTSSHDDGPLTADNPLEMISYISLASKSPTESDLTHMLKEARLQNEKNQITGSLLYREGTYVQVFEGPPHATESLYKKILTDKRHHKVVTLFRRPTKRRYFRDWTMAFRTLSQSELDYAKDYAENLKSAPEDTSDATKEILDWIKSLICEFSPAQPSEAEECPR